MLELLLNVTEAIKDASNFISLVRAGHFPLQGFDPWRRSPTRPLPAIASSTTERPCISSTSCRK
jgi:hypothetical protein